jgi:probable HAF family extracellular repeat protein
MRSYSVCLSVCMLLLALSGESQTAEYRFQRVDLPFAEVSFPVVRGINDRGDLVGTYVDAGGRIESFVRERGRITPVFLLSISDISNAGHLVGGVVTNRLHGFVARDGTFTFLDVNFPFQPPSSLTEAMGVNDAGQVVGAFRDSAGVFHGFLYDSTTRGFTVLDVPFPHSLTGAAGINNHGDIVGFYQDPDLHSHGFLKEDDIWTPIDIPGGIGGTQAFGINDAGQIVGIVFTQTTGPEGNRGFVYDHGQITIIHVPGAIQTELWGINNEGQLVGRYIDSEGVGHGLLATPYGKRIAHGTADPDLDAAGPVLPQVAHAVALGPCPPGSGRWVCRHSAGE